MIPLHPNIELAIIGLFGTLVIASIVLTLFKHIKPNNDYKSLTSRIKSWWMMIFLFSTALVIGRSISIVFFAIVSFLAFKEYLTMIPTRRADHRVLVWAYLCIPLQYYWVNIEWYGVFIIFIPVYAFLFLSSRMVLIGETDGFVKAVGTLHWGLMLCVFCISHVAYLLILPGTQEQSAGGPALVLFLVILTQANDVAQYLWGKSLGKSKVIPKVSPNKTNAGFYGGLLTTCVLALALGNLLTPFSLVQALGAGILIAGSGFVGDITISALKRDIGLKDSGTLIPGHGGILDRVDSLTFTAPLFFHYTYFLAY